MKKIRQRVFSNLEEGKVDLIEKDNEILINK